MLDEVRHAGRTKGIWATIIFGFICLIFVFVGMVPGQRSGGGVGAAATVNDVVIPMYDFQETLGRYEGQMAGQMKDLPTAQRRIREKSIRQEVMQSLVNYELAYQAASGAGVLPVKPAIREMILNIPAFQNEGRFERDRYNQYLEYVRTTAADFERKVGRDVVIGQMRDLFQSSWRKPTSLTSLEREMSNTKLNAEVVVIDREKLSGKDSLKDAEVNAWLQVPENKKRVEDHYNANMAQYRAEEQVRARHILIKGDTEASKKKIEDIRKEAETGDFAELAKKYSEDEGSKTKGGDLDYFGRGRMVPEFENAAFSSEVGKVTAPIKTDYGYHIIKVEDRRGGQQKTLQDVQLEIARQLYSEGRYDEVLKELEAKLEKGEAIDATLQKFGLKWEESGEFAVSSFSVPKVNAGDEAMTALLSLSKPGETYKKLVRAGTQAYALRLKNLSLAKPSNEDKSGDELAAFGGGAEVFGGWAEERKKEARIIINESVLE